MPTTILIQDLQKLGLSDKEAKVYLASLELGPAPIAAIAKQASVNRPTTYVIIESLIKKGLMSSFDKGKKTFFSAESPERLLSLLRLKEKETQEQAREFETILPDLKKLYSLAGGAPKVRFFEGKKGIQAIQEDIIASKPEEIDEFTSLDDAYAIFPPTSTDHRHKMQNEIKQARAIYTSKKGPILENIQDQASNQKKFVPPDKYPFSCDVILYSNKVAIIAYKNLIGVLIEDQEIAQMFNLIFELSWVGATNVV